MSYHLGVLADLPRAYVRAGTGASDAAGLVPTVNVVGTTAPVFDQPGLTAGGRSTLFADDARLTLSLSRHMVQGYEEDSFAWEVWVKFDGPPSNLRMLMGRAATSGLRATSAGIEFQAASDDGNTYSAYYSVTDWTKPLHIVANYVGRNLGLIVNGEEGTNADFYGNFTYTGGTLALGGLATSTTRIWASDFAVYGRSLNIREATRHYDLGRTGRRPLDSVTALGGTYYSMDDEAADVAYSYSERTAADFLAGTTDNITIEDDALVAYESGVHTSPSQFIGTAGSIAGSRINWEGSLAPHLTVDVSLDLGTTWTACTNNAEIPGLGPGGDTANKFIMFRKTFTESSAHAAPARLDSLSFVLYRSKVVKSNFALTSLSVTGNPKLAPKALPPLERSDNMGAVLVAPDHFTIPGGGDAISAVEFWFRRDAVSTAWAYIVDTRDTNRFWLAFDSLGNVSSSGATFYINGVSKTPAIGDFPLNIWVHVVANLTTSVTGDILLNSRFNSVEQGSHSFAHVTTYPTTPPMNATKVAANYRSQVGIATASLTDANAFTVTEVSTNGYSRAWSSVQSGIG